ncbi:ribonuclease BN [Rhodoferax koreense]|uniref:Ribonuclease BN n=1 Tax=Rhodoferax koreensis TaxID=1842727 RepID=A0A1P8JQC0_9BURK|nr:YihY/virulence factor BrkB family protein [Rhodoferax koreense]APW35944.1 ribonuclease BN [Rhodoferax koreense]
MRLSLPRLLSTLTAPVRTVHRAVELWLEADGLRMSAAMSFYGILSLAPLLVLVVAVVGWWVDKSIIEHNLIQQIRELIGVQGAQLVQQALDSAKRPAEGALASVVAFVLLLSGATGVFAELQNAFEMLWQHGVPNPVKPKWWRSASLRLRGIAYILAFGFLLLVSLVISAALNFVSGWAGSRWLLEAVFFVLNELVSFAFCTGLFVALMRMSVGRKPSLRFLVMGAMVGALLFTLGKHLLAAYLSGAAAVSAYGAAGSLVVMLMWIYFSSAILLFSACCARCIADAALDRGAPG